MSDTGLPQQKLVIERIYNASVAELWALWTTREGFESWWGPEGFRVEVQALDAREGGPLAYEMIADAPEAIAAMTAAGQPISHATHGWFSAYRPMDHLGLSHMIDFVPGMEPYETLIEVDFQGLGDMTRMTVTLHPHREPFWTDMSAQGFASQLSKLDRRFGFEG